MWIARIGRIWNCLIFQIEKHSVAGLAPFFLDVFFVLGWKHNNFQNIEVKQDIGKISRRRKVVKVKSGKYVEKF